MSNTTNITVAESPFSKYAAALLPFAIIIVGALQTVIDDPTNWSVIVAFALLVLGTFVAYVLKLVPGKWQGRLKTGAQIVTVVLTAAVPFILPTGFDPEANITIIVVAILNAIATEFGVQIRKDAFRLAA
jgi:glucan phosphoethanolaminetransferase (alkaline phosphatase superfamily)